MARRKARYAVAAGTALAYVSLKLQLFGLLFDRPDLKTADEWRRISDTPGADKGYSPQGITVVGEDLVFSNHWDGERSCLYRLDPDTGRVATSSMMPDEATHTSGLAWDGTFLWAVDHGSNRLYKLDLAETFASERAAVVESVATGLRGSSALTALAPNGTTHLAVSDFLWTIETTPSLPSGTGRTYVFRPEDVESGEPVPACARHSYPNGGYSQGLTWDGRYLYESLNAVGTNRIEVIEIPRQSSDTAPIERVGSFEAPGYFVEDLATDGSRLWTTDERLFGLYELDLRDNVASHLPARDG